MPSPPTTTNTPVPATNTNTPVNTNTNTPVPATNTRTNTVVPPTTTNTNTPVPATNTRTNTVVPPTNTFTNTPVPATNTNTPVNTNTNTPVPATNTRTNTAVPPTTTRTVTRTPTIGTTPCSTCNLNVTNVSIQCTAGCYSWSATVVNSGSCTVVTSWKAQLQQHQPGSGGFSNVPGQSQMGSQAFPPGTTIVSGTFCYNAPPNVNSIRIEFKLDAAFGNCTPKRKSQSIPPCRAAGAPDSIFTDLPVNAPFYWEASALQSAGVVSGYADGTFRPNGSVTRSQAAKMLAAAFELDLTNSGEQRFSDVPSDHTFYTYVQAAAAKGWISGYADGTFRPFANVTRGQVAKMVMLATGLKLESPATATFQDVAAGSTYYPYIETAYAHRIVAGYPDGTFRPGAEATRGQLAKIVLNAAYPSIEE